MAIENWMSALASKLGEITGIEQVHTYADLPGVLTVFPSIVIMPTRGPSANYSAGGPNIALHQVQATLYVSAQVMPEAYALAVPFIGRVTRKLASALQLGGLTYGSGRIHHVIPDPASPWYEGPGGIEYGTDSSGEPRRHLGIIFRLEVKETETFTVSA